MKTRNQKIKIFYCPEMAYQGLDNSYSNSPKKPKLFVEQLMLNKEFESDFEILSFNPYNIEDFYLAHSKTYVENFFSGKEPLASSNNIKWSLDFAETVKYTNASLYESIKHSLLYPEDLCCSPTSGFHHASPNKGGGFCTFSGQVLASLKIYNELGKVGVYFDLDGHFGNSISNHKKAGTTPDLDIAIPSWGNINPGGQRKQYLLELEKKLELFKSAVLKKEVDYVVWCHGADSCIGDNLGGSVNAEEWLMCTKMFKDCIKDIEQHIQRTFPVSYVLFGGYRNNYNEVLDLHVLDTMELLKLQKENNKETKL